MRHGIKNKKLNKTTSHKKAMFANMAVALVMHEQIETTLPKAKALRPYIEKLVTAAGAGDLTSRRRLLAKIKDKQAVEKLLSVLGGRYKERKGGYTRIVKAGFRYGDMAPKAIIEFVERDVSAKGRDYYSSAVSQNSKVENKETKTDK